MARRQIRQKVTRALQDADQIQGSIRIVGIYLRTQIENAFLYLCFGEQKGEVTCALYFKPLLQTTAEMARQEKLSNVTNPERPGSVMRPSYQNP